MLTSGVPSWLRRIAIKSTTTFNLHVLLAALLFLPTVRCLSCYECDNCKENMAYLNDVVKECPNRSYVSCLRTESRFAHHTIVSRSCSRAPSMNVASCSTHMVNIMRASVCLCSSSLCNGLHSFREELRASASQFDTIHNRRGGGIVAGGEENIHDLIRYDGSAFSPSPSTGGIGAGDSNAEFPSNTVVGGGGSGRSINSLYFDDVRGAATRRSGAGVSRRSGDHTRHLIYGDDNSLIQNRSGGDKLAAVKANSLLMEIMVLIVRRLLLT